jgi:hypothetical protein
MAPGQGILRRNLNAELIRELDKVDGENNRDQEWVIL